MDWILFADKLGTFGISASVIGLVLGYLIRTLITSQISKDIEVFKSNLLKEQLEHEIKYSRMHEKRVLVVGDLYSLLTRAKDAFGEIIESNQHEIDESGEKNVDVLRDFSSFLQENQIYFDPGLCRKLNEIDELMRIGGFFYFKSQNPNKTQEKREKYLKAWKLMEKRIPKLKKTIEKEFRELLDPPATKH